MDEITKTLRGLNADQRHEARQTAIERIKRRVGKEPRWADFERADVGQWPRQVTALAVTLLIIVFVAAGSVTLFRLYSAGRTQYQEVMTLAAHDQWQAGWVGLATFLLAEFTVVSSVFAARVLFRDGDRWRRRGMGIAVLFGLAVAFVGNWTIDQPHDVWAWLLTVTPPIAVLVTALILEALALQSVETRHKRRLAWQEAMRQWDDLMRAVEAHPRFKSEYANAIREAIYTLNNNGRNAKVNKALMDGMSDQEWSALVWREMQADDWFSEDAIANFTPQPSPVAASHNGQGR
jgi:uncharacterized membrane protein YecN with MAPEG domain